MGTKKKDKHARNGVDENLLPEDEVQQNVPPRSRKYFSFLGNLIFLCTLAIIAGIGFLVYQTWIPRNLSELKGYKQAEDALNIPALLNEAYKKNTALTLSEEDINRYIAATLKASQSGFSSTFTRPNGVGIKLHDGYMEVFIERQLASDYLQTVSLFVTVIQLESPSSKHPVTNLEYRKSEQTGSYITAGGTLGSLSVPQGYVHFILPAFENLASAYQDVLSSIIDNNRIIRIRTGYVDIMPGAQFR